MATDPRSVQVRHPAPHDLVAETFAVAGIGTGFEGTVGWRLLDSHGGTIKEGGTQAGGMAVMGEISFSIDLAGHGLGANESALTLQVFGDNPGLPDEGPDPGFDVNTIPVTLGPQLVAGYVGFQLYTVKPGDWLSKIASENQFGSTTANAIFAANRDQLHDPDLIHPGQVLRIPLGGA